MQPTLHPKSRARADGRLSESIRWDPVSDSTLVSVVIAAYNAEDYIHHALESVLKNQGVSLEVIVVDDCSSDKTTEVVEAYEKGYNQVCLLRRSKKGGPSAARNDGIRQATSKWIAVLDVDDEFLPQRLMQLTDGGQLADVEAVADNLQLFNFGDRIDGGFAFPASWASNEPLSLEKFVGRDFPGSETRWRSIGLCKPIVRRQFLVDHNLFYDEDISMAEDLLFYCRLIAAGGRFVMIKDAYYRYALRPQSLSQREAPSASNSNHLDKLLLVNERLLALDNSVKFVRLLKMRRRALWYEQFAIALKEGRPLEAFKAFRQAGLLLVGSRTLKRLFSKLKSAVDPDHPSGQPKWDWKASTR